MTRSNLTLIRLVGLAFVVVACGSSASNESPSSAAEGVLHVVKLDSTRLLEGPDDPLVNPTDLEVSANRYYVLDPLSKDVKVFSRDGSFQTVIGRPGRGPGEFTLPTDMTVRDQNVAILDRAEMRISRFTASGEFVETVPIPPGRYTAMADLGDGRILLAGRLAESTSDSSGGSATLHLISPAGEYLDGIGLRSLPSRPYERDIEVFHMSQVAGGVVCAFTQASNVGMRYDAVTGELTSVTFTSSAYRPVEWPVAVGPGGDFRQLADWWGQQMRITAVLAGPGDVCLGEFFDPVDHDHFIVASDRFGHARFEIRLPAEEHLAIFETNVADTLYALRVNEDASVTIERYLLKGIP